MGWIGISQILYRLHGGVVCTVGRNRLNSRTIMRCCIQIYAFIGTCLGRDCRCLFFLYIINIQIDIISIIDNNIRDIIIMMRTNTMIITVEESIAISRKE